MAISEFGRIIEFENEKIFVTRGIYEYMNKANFDLLCSAYREAQKHNAKLYIGLYSNRLLKKSGKGKEISNLVSDNDRINLAEAFDMVDGAFVINCLNKKAIEEACRLRLLKKRNDAIENLFIPSTTKKYEVGYASGAFSNLHKGHVEHLQEMRKLCKTVIVAVNSDELIQNYKNKKASVSDKTRRAILSHVKYVDLALITNDYDKTKAVDKIRNLVGKPFNAIFVGSDWKGDPKWDAFETELGKRGIDVVYTDRPKNGISTSKIDRMKANKKKNILGVRE